VETLGATSVGTTAFTANGRIQPRGLPGTYYVEYGPSRDYGFATAERPLPPKLAAFYRETWQDGLAGWQGGISASDLVHVEDGADNGFVRYTDPQGAGDDTHHFDGIGVVHLTKWMYTGTATGPFATAALGGGDPDLRGAHVRVRLRGHDWQPNGTELVFWTQSDSDLAKQNTSDFRRANWAFTGFSLTESLASTEWTDVGYRLVNDSRLWSYAGRYGTRPNYAYWPLDDSLAHVNADFIHMLVFVNQAAEPSGTIDFDEFEVAYRNHSLLLPSNGGRLTAFPRGSTSPAALTDGWRNGPDHTWRSRPKPREPQEFEYEFATPVTIHAVQIHQDPEWPSRDVEVLVSEDGVAWTSLASEQPSWTLPRTAISPNHAFVWKRAIDQTGAPVPLYDAPVRRAKVRILSGYDPHRWGLGEIEMFGTGAVMATDDDWYEVSQDVEGVAPGETVHYRFVTTTAVGTVEGPDMTFTVPDGSLPEVVTGPASRISGSTAKVEGRLNPLGHLTRYYFEFGEDESYGKMVPGPFPYSWYGGTGFLPRTVAVELTGLVSGQYHYRLVATTESETAFGEDAVFHVP
jgi:hypothetical protein